MNQALIVIPYLAKESQGCELELAVEGWSRHFKQPHVICIVGDWDEQVQRILRGRRGANVFFREVQRADAWEDQYLPHIDIVQKFLKARDVWMETDGFIYACDDMYAVRDFTMGDVLRVKYEDRWSCPVKMDWRKEKGWMRDYHRTMALNRIFGYGEKNYVCHLPVYYDWNLAIDIIHKYDLRFQSFILENIYFNVDSHDEKAEAPASVYGYEVKDSAPPFFKLGEAHVTWITNTNSGWSPALEKMLRKHYGL